MPTLLRKQGFWFLFRVNDGVEPPHVHVRSEAGWAKIWLAPQVKIAGSRGYTQRQRGRILGITEKRKVEFLAAWGKYFGSS